MFAHPGWAMLATVPKGNPCTAVVELKRERPVKRTRIVRNGGTGKLHGEESGEEAEKERTQEMDRRNSRLVDSSTRPALDLQREHTSTEYQADGHFYETME